MPRIDCEDLTRILALASRDATHRDKNLNRVEGMSYPLSTPILRAPSAREVLRVDERRLEDHEDCAGFDAARLDF